MTNERAAEILNGGYARSYRPTFAERDEAMAMGAAALQAQSELLDALEEITFPDRVSIGASLMWQEIDVLDLLVKHGRVTKTPSGAFEWVSK